MTAVLTLLPGVSVSLSCCFVDVSGVASTLTQGDWLCEVGQLKTVYFVLHSKEAKQDCLICSTF